MIMKGKKKKKEPKAVNKTNAIFTNQKFNALLDLKPIM